MSVQTSISRYFSNRKRAADGPQLGKPANKMLILESESKGDVSPKPVPRAVEPTPPPQPTKTPKDNINSSSSSQVRTPTTNSQRKAPPLKPSRPVRKSLFPPVVTTTQSQDKTTANIEDKKKEVIDEKPLIPSLNKDLPATNSAPTPKLGSTPQKQQPLTSKKVTSRQELGLSEIRSKLIKTSRRQEIFAALERLKEGQKKLDEITERKQQLETDNKPSISPPPSETGGVPPKSPCLQKFKTIELEVPTSPVKAMREHLNELKSPSKSRLNVFKSPPQAPNMIRGTYVSPRKLLEEKMAERSTTLKLPAYQNYLSLTAGSGGKGGLPLPYRYRLLAEVFRCVDNTVAMLYNRAEIATFPKVNRAIRQLLNKNLTETHLGQILSILPGVYNYSQEKVHQFGQSDKYHLVITPNLTIHNSSSTAESDNDTGNDGCGKKGDRELMTPSMVLERKRAFYDALLTRTKDHHEMMLLSLEPPLHVKRELLTRWHPDFDVESCPEIKPAQIPRPPNADKYSTAKDVLDKARDMFMMNPRMEKALEKLSNAQQRNDDNGNENNKKITGGGTAANAAASLTSALKGIPKSLLEKVRAKQAAKAMMLLVQDPNEDKKQAEFSRLPEMARILRNLYVLERKNVLPFNLVINKLCSSYKEILSPSEMEHHVNLIIDHVPGWLTVVEQRAYLRLAKDVQMNSVMATLKNLINQNPL